jgi:hypothetical protein
LGSSSHLILVCLLWTFPNQQGSERTLSPSIGTTMDFCNAIEQNGMRKKN